MCVCVRWDCLAVITMFISIHVFHSWLMSTLPSERCPDRMWPLMENGKSLGGLNLKIISLPLSFEVPSHVRICELLGVTAVSLLASEQCQWSYSWLSKSDFPATHRRRCIVCLVSLVRCIILKDK